jgi:quinoprotein glucose dehydrogenase
MKRNYRLGVFGFCSLFILSEAHAQTDWPIFGHDPGAMRYSPLKQINTSNVEQLRPAWQFDTTEENVEPATAPITPHANLASEASAEATPSPKPSPGSEQPAPPARRPPPRLSESIPLVAGGILYMSTGYNRVVALDTETGRKLWEYESKHPTPLRGVSYWPGTKGYPSAIVFGTLDGWLISLNAKTGRSRGRC